MMVFKHSSKNPHQPIRVFLANKNKKNYNR